MKCWWRIGCHRQVPPRHRSDHNSTQSLLFSLTSDLLLKYGQEKNGIFFSPSELRRCHNVILGLGDSVFSRKLVELNLKRQFLFGFHWLYFGYGWLCWICSPWGILRVLQINKHSRIELLLQKHFSFKFDWKSSAFKCLTFMLSPWL